MTDSDIPPPTQGSRRLSTNRDFEHLRCLDWVSVNISSIIGVMHRFLSATFLRTIYSVNNQVNFKHCLTLFLERITLQSHLFSDAIQDRGALLFSLQPSQE